MTAAQRHLAMLTRLAELLKECRNIFAVSHAPRHNKLVVRIDHQLGRVKRMGVLPGIEGDRG